MTRTETERATGSHYALVSHVKVTTATVTDCRMNSPPGGMLQCTTAPPCAQALSPPAHTRSILGILLTVAHFSCSPAFDVEPTEDEGSFSTNGSTMIMMHDSAFHMMNRA